MVWVIFRGPSRIGMPREPSDCIVPRCEELIGEPYFGDSTVQGLRGLRPLVRLPLSFIVVKVASPDGDFTGLSARVRGEAGLMSAVRKLYGTICGSLRTRARDS